VLSAVLVVSFGGGAWSGVMGKMLVTGVEVRAPASASDPDYSTIHVVNGRPLGKPGAVGLSAKSLRCPFKLCQEALVNVGGVFDVDTTVDTYGKSAVERVEALSFAGGLGQFVFDRDGIRLRPAAAK
jgi:hypothetical protein